MRNPRNGPPGGRRRGYTIPEVAFAVVVMAMAITTALAALQRAFLELDTARNLTLAGNIMQAQLEKERLLPWTEVSNPGYRPAIDSSFMSNPAVAGRFTLSRAVSVLPARDGRMVQVTLTVTWRGYDGRVHSRNYLTYFSRDGLYNYIYSGA